MICRARAQGPEKEPFLGRNAHIVDACFPPPHQPSFVKFPLFIPMASEPVAAVVMPLIGKSNRNAIDVECPQRLDQPVFELALPFPLQKSFNHRAAGEELRSISPTTVGCVCLSDAHWIPAVPGVFSHSGFNCSTFSGEGRDRRAIRHDNFPKMYRTVNNTCSACFGIDQPCGIPKATTVSQHALHGCCLSGG